MSIDPSRRVAPPNDHGRRWSEAAPRIGFGETSEAIRSCCSTISAMTVRDYRAGVFSGIRIAASRRDLCARRTGGAWRQPRNKCRMGAGDVRAVDDRRQRHFARKCRKETRPRSTALDLGPTCRPR